MNVSACLVTRGDVDTEGAVYGLFDLRDPEHEIRYVGKTLRKLEARLAQHLLEGFNPKRKHTHCGSWLASIGRDNVGIKVLERTSRKNLNACERKWISRLRPLGRLTNHTDGGDGGSGPRSAETRAKISASLKGRPKSKEHAAKAGAARRGIPFTEEQREKLREAHRRNPRTHSEETKRRMSESNRRAWARRKAAA